MITAGVDVGVLYTKTVILRDGAVLGRSAADTGGAGRAKNISAAWERALREAGISEREVEGVCVTGRGKFDVPFAGEPVTLPVCLAEAARALCPDATCVLDLGADFGTAVSLKPDGRIQEFAFSQKCSLGCGFLVEALMDRTGLDYRALNSLPYSEAETVSDGCAVFAEMDFLSLLNRGVPVEAALAAAVRSIAVRALVMLHELTIADRSKICLSGGLAALAPLVTALEKQSGLTFTVPGSPREFGAMGAALLAGKRKGEDPKCMP